MSITMTGDAALAMKYAAALARARCPEVEGMTDDEIISWLIDVGLHSCEEVSV